MNRTTRFTLIAPAFAALLALCLGMPGAGAGPQAGKGRGRHNHGYGDGRGRFVRPAPEQAPFLEVQTATAGRQTMGAAVEATGTLSPCPDSVARVGPVISGRVSEVLARLGDRVTAGQPLAKLVSVEIGEAVSAYYKAVAELELARINFERYERLISRNIGAKKDLLAAEADLKIAEANGNAAEKTLHAFGFTEEDVEQIEATHRVNAELLLRSPISGTVVERNATVGERVGDDSTLFTVMDLGRLFVDAQVFERDAARLRRGQRIEIAVNALPGRTFAGELIHVSQRIDPETRTLSVRTALDNPEGTLKVGMYATVRIFTGTDEPLLCVPAAAVIEDGGESWVFVPDGDGYRLVPVTTGARDGELVQVVDGLDEGQTVVTTGSYGLYASLRQGSGPASSRTH